MARYAVAFAVVCVAHVLAACSPSQTAFATGDTTGALGSMQGSGALIQRPYGKQGFRFAIAANAYDGLIEPGKHEAQRERMMSQWLGARGACPAGYSVGSRTEVQGTIVYEGSCT